MSRHGSAEIWGFQYGVTFVLGALGNMARAGFFGLVVLTLNCATNDFQHQTSMILAYRRGL